MPLKMIKEMLDAINPFSLSGPKTNSSETVDVPKTSKGYTPTQHTDSPRPASRALEDASVASLSRVARPTWTPPKSVLGCRELGTSTDPDCETHAEVRSEIAKAKAPIREYANRALTNFQYTYEVGEPEPAPERKTKGRREL